MLENVAVTEVIDGLCEELQNTELEDAGDDAGLLEGVGDAVVGYIESVLGEAASVWVEGRDRGKIKPVWAFGADYAPTIAVEVAGLPTVAIEVRLATRASGPADSVGVGVGRAIMYSLQYSFVIVLVLDRSDSDLRKHWFDAEVEARLWDEHRISLIVRR